MKGTEFNELADRCHDEWLRRFYQWRGLPYGQPNWMKKIIKINKRLRRGIYPRGKVFQRMLLLNHRPYH